MKTNILLVVCVIMFPGLNIFAQLTPHEAVVQMERGINLGNTLEPHYENSWNNPPAEEVYFDLYKEAGFDVVRVPVRWDKHTDGDFPYLVLEEWMDRVEEVVDWGLSRNLFIVINAHHEEWIKAGYSNPVFRARFDSIWSQIAVRFKDKSEKLIFEIINEPHGLSQQQNDELHHRVLGIIRKTNPTRNVIIQGHNWGGSDELISMAIPDDDFLIGSFHSYDPWPFGLEGTGSFGTSGQIQQLDNKFAEVKSWSVQNSIPIFLGEFACHRGAEYNSRMKHYRAYVNLSLSYGFTYCAWDDGGNFGVMIRNARSWNEIKDILIYCSSEAPTITGLSIVQDTMIDVRWNKGTGGPDTISVQRKIDTGPFITIARLSPDSSVYLDKTVVGGKAHYYRIIAHHPGDTVRQSNPLRIYMPVYVLKVREYFLGAPHTIPGTIEAEDFDMGGEGLTYHDMDSKNIAGAYRPEEAVDIFDMNGKAFHIGNALPGEWYEYSVIVEEEAEYLVEVHYSSIYSGGTFVLKVGEELSDTLETSRTNSWLVTDKVSLFMNLESGSQIMRFNVVDKPLFNIDKVIFALNTTGMELSSLEPEIHVYQDPGGNLIIEPGDDATIDLVQLIHISGAIAASHSHLTHPYRLSTDGMNPGIYLVRAYFEGFVTHRKIIIH